MVINQMGHLAMLGKALAENRLEDQLKLLAQPQLLIIDESGISPLIGAGRQPVLPAHLPAV